MRFEVTQVLDVIERHLTTESSLAQAVVDLGHVAWYGALDGGRPVSLLRAGLLIDALSRHLGEDAVMVYPVTSRELLTDADLTSKERMVLGRWSGDGVIEVVPFMGDRVPEVADITGLPVVTIDGFPGLERRYPWLRGVPERVLHLVPAEGGARIIGGQPLPAVEGRAALLGRVWTCVRRDCPLFGDRRGHAQAVPRMRAGVPVCPRHDEPLTNAGPRPPSLTMVLIVDGAVRERFVVRTGRPVVVGRAPDDPTGIAIGGFLDGPVAQMVSRNHVRLELLDDGCYAADLSTNGTLVHKTGAAAGGYGPYGSAQQVHLKGGAPHLLGPGDTLELHTGVVLARADRIPAGLLGGQGSVMGDAPTMTIRPQL
ncbi:MAG TPA: FHA domain-containing protein [Micromonosporaceae bacterium]|jgi:hypothetical protein